MNRKRSIPDHELLGSIGTGSYGTVWLARNVLGTQRAVKIIERQAFKDQAAFDREFSGLQRYEPISREHEGFVDILHVGRNDKAGFFYYVMELADNELTHGDPEDDVYSPSTLVGKRFSDEDCLQLGLTLTAALEQLHRRGLVHRDIKPANIILVKGVPKLADIGLVAQAGNTTFVGTEGYIPHEGPGTPQADLYALGKVLYVLSTGNEAAKYPESPVGLDARLLRVIQKACALRYKTAAEMHADLAGDKTSTHNLPASLTSFIGREKELAEIRQLLADCRLLTLTGVGGCGKTRLAIEVGRQSLSEFPDGVWLVELASVTDPALVPKAVASALQIQEQRDRPLMALQDFLRDRQLLLIVDNCEHLVGACAELAEALLKDSAGIRILATSREPLGITGEVHRFVSSLPSDEAVRLFAERARAVQAGFEVTPVVTEICARLDGIPLAIELAAARVRAMSVEQIEQRLSDRFRLLTGGSRTALARQQTLQATIHWSYNLLSEDERTLFCRLSVFAGGWALEAAEVVCAGELDVLTHLVDKSLVIAESGRYRMLETVRQFSQERLAESGQMAALRDAHLKYYSELSKESAAQLFGTASKSWLDRLEMELDNLRAALAWGLEAQPLDALRMATMLEDFWATRGRYSEGRQWLERAAALAPDAPAEDRAPVLEVTGRLAWYQADFDRALPALEESLKLYRQLGNETGMANVQRLRGNCLADLSQHDKAVPLYEESLALYRKLGMLWGVASDLNNLANIAFKEGDYAKARAMYEESFAIDRQVGDPFNSIVVLSNLGSVSMKERDHATARERFAESLRLSNDLGNKRGIAFGLVGLAELAAASDLPELAVRLFGAAEALRKSIGLPLAEEDRVEYEQALAKARAALTPEAFAAAFENGKTISLAAAVALALQPPK